MRYSQAVWQRVLHPERGGAFPDGTPDVVTGRAGAHGEADEIELQVQVDAAGVVQDARFLARGCGALIASASWLAEALPGHPLSDPDLPDEHTLASALALPPVRRYCAALVADALHAARQDFHAKYGA